MKDTLDTLGLIAGTGADTAELAANVAGSCGSGVRPAASIVLEIRRFGGPAGGRALEERKDFSKLLLDLRDLLGGLDPMGGGRGQDSQQSGKFSFGKFAHGHLFT